MTDVYGFLKNKNVVLTGGVGSVGSELVRQIRRSEASVIRIIDNNESALFDMENALRDDPRLQFFQCDICHENEMRRAFAGMDLCFHAAALKHVPSCERSPFSAVDVNIRGVEIVGRAALANNLERVLFTSSDKAVNPTNVMGTSKLMGERLFTAMNSMRGGNARTIFTSTRFGNVVGSRGSVVPLFVKQIEEGGPVTVTDRGMTRFVMTVSQAANLVIESMALARGGEVFITKMPVLRIVDLAEALIREIAPIFGRDPASIEIAVVGSRPGEKLWEELSTEEESRRILEDERFLVVLPAIASADIRASYVYPGRDMKLSSIVYHSERETPMTAEEMARFLRLPGVLPEAIRTRLTATPQLRRVV